MTILLLHRERETCQEYYGKQSTNQERALTTFHLGTANRCFPCQLLQQTSQDSAPEEPDVASKICQGHKSLHIKTAKETP